LTLFPVFVGSKPSRAHPQHITFILWLGGIACPRGNRQGHREATAAILDPRRFRGCRGAVYASLLPRLDMLKSLGWSGYLLNLAQSQTGSLAKFLGGEERLKWAQRVRAHADAGSFSSRPSRPGLMEWVILILVAWFVCRELPGRCCRQRIIQGQSPWMPSIARPRLPEHHFLRVPQSRDNQRICTTQGRGGFDFNWKLLGRSIPSLIRKITHERYLQA
jgi:hypothetical protein